MLWLILIASCPPELTFRSNDVCYNKERAIECRAEPLRQTRAGCYFQHGIPDLAYYGADGRFHAHFGSCDVSCIP